MNVLQTRILRPFRLLLGGVLASAIMAAVHAVPVSESCILVCPDNLNVNAELGQCGAIVTYAQPTTSGDCAGLTIQCAPASGGFFPVGTTIVRCSALDDQQQSVAGCTFTITVKDNEAPQISFPANMTRCTDPGKSTVKVEYAVETHDNCGNVQVVCDPSSGSEFAKGVTEVHCTTEGGGGDPINASFTVTVDDCGTPEIQCPANIVRCADQGKCTAIVTFQATSSANVVCSPASGSEFPKGSTTVTCTATGPNDETAQCSFSVQVDDCEAPVIACPADMVRCKDAGKQTAAVSYALQATDVCGAATVVCTPPSGTEFSAGVSTVNCTATDAAGKTAACSFKVTVNDCEAPQVQITCPANITQCADAGKCTAVVSYQVTASQGAQVSCQPASGTTFPKGATTVNCNAANSSGNQAQCSFTVTVTDCEAPTIHCPADIVRCLDAGKQSAVVQFQSTATDACGSLNVTCAPASGTAFPKGTTTVTCTAADPAGKSAACSFKVTVNDCAPVEFTCPANITQCNDAGQCSAVVNYPINAAAFASVVCEPSSGAAFPKGVTTVHCVATDATGAKSNCAFNVTVNVCDPPDVVAVEATPSVLWPPNHQMVPVTLDISTKNCEPADCRIVAVESNEDSGKPGNGNGNGNGNGQRATAQWKITGDLELELQAERKGNGNGRVYTVTIECTDAAGHKSTSQVLVPVAHDHSTLTLSRKGKDMVLTWDSIDSESILETTDDLTHPNWKPVPKPSKNEVVIPTTTGRKFYRLRQ